MNPSFRLVYDVLRGGLGDSGNLFLFIWSPLKEGSSTKHKKGKGPV